VETFAHNLAGKIAEQMNFDKDKKAVIAYGLTAIIQMITIFFIISVIGLLFLYLPESTLSENQQEVLTLKPCWDVL